MQAAKSHCLTAAIAPPPSLPPSHFLPHILDVHPGDDIQTALTIIIPSRIADRKERGRGQFTFIVHPNSHPKDITGETLLSNGEGWHSSPQIGFRRIAHTHQTTKQASKQGEKKKNTKIKYTASSRESCATDVADETSKPPLRPPSAL